MDSVIYDIPSRTSDTNNDPDPQTNIIQEQQPLRRSTRQKFPPKKYRDDNNTPSHPARPPQPKSISSRFRSRKMPPKKATAIKDSKISESAAGATKSGRVTKPKSPVTKKAPAAKSKAAPKSTPAAAKKATIAKKEAAPAKENSKSSASKKRKSDDESRDEPAPPSKRSRAPPKERAPAPPRPKVIINHAPTQKLDLLVFGANSGSELGLGPDVKSGSVKRPRLNPYLTADKAGVVAFACGGMHSIALTHDNQLLTWGVNDHGALGRDTTWNAEPLKDMDAANDSSSDSSSDSGAALNPLEATPSPIDPSSFPPNTIFTAVAATDSATFTITNDGLVYGWGLFRSIDGPLGFSPTLHTARAPTLIPTLTKITRLATGSNHVLALSQSGTVYAWGAGEMNQLGRRIIERNRLNGLSPRAFGLTRNFTAIAAGSEHSFAIRNDGQVLAWGLNNFGQTGVDHGIGEDNATVLTPSPVPSLAGRNVVALAGGNHHSIALTASGTLLVFGRCENHALGIPLSTLPQDDTSIIRSGPLHKPVLSKSALAIPTTRFAAIAAASDHNVCAGTDGKPYSWGFSAEYQTGQGTDDDVEVVTAVENTAVRGRTIVRTGCGGQFGVVGAAVE